MNHSTSPSGRAQERDLFGDPIPADGAEIVASYLLAVRAQGELAFNSFRVQSGVDHVPRHFGALVRAACENAGLERGGTETARVRASRGRLCRRWRIPESAQTPAPAERQA